MTADAELIERLREHYRSEMSRFLIPEGNEDRKCVDWVPIGILRETADRLAALIAGPERKEVESAEIIDRLEATGGHNKPCHNCGATCNGLAGNPGFWPICLPVEGMPTWFCTSCIASMRDKAAKNEREVAALIAERDTLREALTPSTATKFAYAGEICFSKALTDEDGHEHTERVYVPWTCIKDIMRMIAARAALSAEQEKGLIPNEVTIAAMKEAADGNLQRFSSIDEALVELNKEDVGSQPKESTT